MNRVRTPVSAFRDDTGDTVVVMDDGAVFYRSPTNVGGPWETMPPLPGTIEAQIQAQPAPETVLDPRD